MVVSEIAARSMRHLVRITATPTFIYIDQGLASNECWRSSPWGGVTLRVENISRNNSRALPSQLIIPITSSTLSTLCPHTSFHIAHVKSFPRSGTSKFAAQHPSSRSPALSPGDVLKLPALYCGGSSARFVYLSRTKRIACYTKRDRRLRAQ